MTEHAETGAAAGNGLLRGKVAVVTGGGDGIGGAISRTFARAGARVILVTDSAGLASSEVKRLLMVSSVI